jgi:hypothetical protein
VRPSVLAQTPDFVIVHAANMCIISVLGRW